MFEDEAYLEETKAVTDCFSKLSGMLRKRGYKSAAYFLSVAFEAYNQDLDSELKQIEQA